MTPDDGETLFSASRFRVVRRNALGGDGRMHARDIVEHPGSVVILPLVDDDRICLIENYRVAASGRLWELPAGTLDKGESIESMAHRELREETGYRAGQMDKSLEFYVSPGISNELMHLYIARDLTAGDMELEPGEDIRVRVVARVEALAMIDRGEIRDGKTLVGLLHYERLRAQSR